jgi:hypothetical protein
VKAGVDAWLAAADVSAGPVFRAINKVGRIGKNGFSPKVVWGVVKTACSKCGLEGVAPHDLRSYAEFRTMPESTTLRQYRKGGEAAQFGIVLNLSVGDSEADPNRQDTLFQVQSEHLLSNLGR